MSAPVPEERIRHDPLVDIQGRVLTYWSATRLPQLLQAGTPGGPEFRFTEGPPSANGAPHIGHLISRILKDIAIRYRRMKGDEIVTPKAGWDCHGLPVELAIEKRLGLHSHKEIETYGVERFCEECRKSTLAVAEMWEAMSRDLGYWLDYEHAYLTMAPEYIESLWWSLKVLFDRGLLEKGYRVLPYCPRCETTLSSHEVAQGYKETTDPSVTVRFRMTRSGEAPARSLLVWTTTPWTLPANLLIAAHPEIPYVVLRAPDGSEWVLAEAALPRYFPEGTPPVVERHLGKELDGLGYEPLFPFAGPGTGRYRIVLDDMVEAKEGTGLVHIAPSFGPEDQRIGEREAVGAFDPLDSRGVFTDQVPLVVGRSFKAADTILLEDLERRQALIQSTTLKHTYPFCWRCSHALLYRALDSWFVRTSRVTSELQEYNQRVHWIPEHLKDGRFGNFLEEAKDWALSRSRYWGTPLPIWVCSNGHPTCIGSFDDLARHTGGPIPAGFDPHRVTVDRLVVHCPDCGADARREPYTIDVWYDSGAAPFAQFHYPFEPGPFRTDRPLDYVAEGLDQTRGWFYTLHVLSTTLFHREAYRVALANEFVLDDTGQKMSKSRGNAMEPMGLLGRYGGDAVRWTFLSFDYTEAMRINDAAFRLHGGRTLTTLLNAVKFHSENARADQMATAPRVPRPTRGLDRWLLSRLEGTILAVDRALEDFEPRLAASAVARLVDELSTWYLRRSRPRFWQEGDPADRTAAHETLSFVLAEIIRLVAPLAPFTAEYLHFQLHQWPMEDPNRSVHRAGWPAPIGARDPELERAMDRVLAWSEVGRELRQRAGVKSRVPLATFVRFGP
ncbi:MAG: isoleucine--tRNA ligase, partial [Thermoplasmata archaeon]